MNFKISFISFLLCLFTGIIYAQERPNYNFYPWDYYSIQEYAGSYHFGFSEDESTLNIIIAHEKVYAQVKSGTFNSTGTAWVWEYRNLTDVRINGNRFYSKETNGTFFIGERNGEKVKGLKLEKSWSATYNDGEVWEFGKKTHNLNDEYSGKFTQASVRVLSTYELNKMTSQELKVMRNEIFARYGYIFKTGGQMESYFRKQDWYKPLQKDVNKYLTELEKENIILIRAAEQKKG